MTKPRKDRGQDSYKQCRRPKANHFDLDSDQDSWDKVFTVAQFDALVATFPEFIKKVNELDPHWQGNCHALMSWKKSQCTRLMESPPFADVPDDMIEKIRAAIIRKYSNFFNYNMKKQSAGKPENFTTATSNSPSFIAFTGTANPRQLFLIKNNAEIQDCYRKIAQDEGIRPVAAYQRVVKEMWDAADQVEWERMAEELTSDVEANRTEFPLLIEEAFNDLLQCGALGSCALSISFAWRNERNEIEGGKVHSAFDSNSQQLIDNFHYDDNEEAQTRWANYVNQILPRKTAVISRTFERTNTGLPLFPKTDLKKITMDVLVDILDDYFLAVWDFTQDGATDVPWERIEGCRWRYFDDTHFLFPKPLRRLSSLEIDEIFSIARYLITTATNDPFTFYNKDDIQESQDAEEDLDQTKVREEEDEDSVLSDLPDSPPLPPISTTALPTQASQREASPGPAPIVIPCNSNPDPKFGSVSPNDPAQLHSVPAPSTISTGIPKPRPKPRKKTTKKAAVSLPVADTTHAPAPTVNPPSAGPSTDLNSVGALQMGLDEEGRRRAPARKRKVPSFRPESVVDHTKTPPKRLKHLKDRWEYVVVDN